MKDQRLNLEEVLKSLLSVISNDRIVQFQTHNEGPTMSAMEAARARKAHENAAQRRGESAFVEWEIT